MAKGRQLKALSSISVGGAPPVSFDSLKAEERAGYADKMCENIGRAVSSYLAEHPDEAAQLLNKGGLNEA